MLGKLLKYEFKHTANLFLLLFGGLLLLSLVNVVLMKISALLHGDNRVLYMISGLLAVLFAIYFIGVLVATVFLCITRFCKNLLGREGYFMHTLPVGSWAHIAAKLIPAIVWTLASLVTMVLSVLIIGMGSLGESFAEIGNALAQAVHTFVQYADAEVYLTLFELGVCLLVGAAVSYLAIYSALSIGYSFNKHKLLLSVAAYAVLYIIDNAVTALLLFAVDRTNSWHHLIAYEGVPHGYLWILIAIMAVFSVAYYLLTNYFLKRRLNLQ